jgi:hypothetical protein
LSGYVLKILVTVIFMACNNLNIIERGSSIAGFTSLIDSVVSQGLLIRRQSAILNLALV